jgi:CubicO group peptidase (beta-lactamase class C family)
VGEAADALIDRDRLDDLIDYAVAHETNPLSNDDLAGAKRQRLRAVLGPDADTRIVGPFTERGRANGLVLRRGRVVAGWGDTSFVAEIASVTKPFLSLLCGIAVGVGLIDDVYGSVHADTRLELLASRHNRQITWHHLLQQTSEWDGVLFGKRPVGHHGDRIGEAVRTPGAYWEYNDVRVNLLARCLLEVFRKPLPDVLRRFVMNKLGASGSWSWHGYQTSNISIGSRVVESVSGGAHWGGGIWMSSNDLALVGQLYLQRGRWHDEPIVADGWISSTTAPCDLNPMYGYLWWLQHDQSGKQVSLAAQGGGSHHCFVIPDHELVVVARWIGNNAWPQFIDKALAIVTDAPGLGPVVYDWSQVNTPRPPISEPGD